MRSQHIHRHNGVVQLIHKALRKGYSGSKLILSDGGKDPTNKTRPTKTMPERLLQRDTHPIPSPTERTPNKPDVVVLWENGMVLKYQNAQLHPGEDDYQELVYKTPTTALQKKLKILEVCYTSLANIEKREVERTDKYAPL